MGVSRHVFGYAAILCCGFILFKLPNGYVAIESNNSSSVSTKKYAQNPTVQALLEGCPSHRTLVVDASTTSLSKFIEATLTALHYASLEVTKDNRPINFLAENYDSYRSVEGGFWTEFGVFTGGTLVKAHSELSKQKSFNAKIAGFDSFEGLPEMWRKSFDKGMFGDAKYEEVRARIPSEVDLYKGWFQDTIPDFLSKHPNVSAAMIHHDGDLFLSTTITLQLLDDRIQPGTHMIFDELIGYPDFEKHEILALWLWMAQRKATVCAMGHMGPIDMSDAWLRPTSDQHGLKQNAWFQVLEC